MDLRAAGKDFDRYLESAAAHGVRLVRSRVHSVLPGAGLNDLLLRYADENGRVQDEPFDLVVLSTGLEISRDTMALAGRLGVELDADRFTQTSGFAPVQTSVPGIYACGAFTGPKDIPQSVMEASAAACAATESLSSARHSRTHSVEVPPERDVTRAKPRIGVFVCNCGINIGGVVRVPEVAQYAASLPGVAYVEENLFTCSQDTQVKISDVIREKGLNRVVIAACTPRTHEALFQETLTSAGLNKYLVEMANIRNHDSWVHADNPDAATRKAKDLVAMAVAKAALAPSLQETELAVNPTALVVGGGVAGMHAALAVAHQGYPVHLVEKSDRLGGNAQRLLKTAEGEDVRPELNSIIDRVAAEEKISVHLNTTVSSADGFVGNFSTKLADNRQTHVIEHGVTILATGAREYRPDQYLCGEHPAVLTHLEMDSALRGDDPRLETAADVVFIQCVGSRNAERPYCSKVCCTHSLTSAIDLKTRYPDINVYILYRDIRAYGQREALYQEARRRGILFFRYTADQPPVVSAADRQVRVLFEDSVIGRQLAIDADLLCLAAAIVPNDIQELARAFKVPVDADGWLQEAHFKLRPVDMASDGIFLCGMAHYPKPLDESISQAQAAAARAVTVLSRGSIRVGGSVARIDPDLCSGCLGCINVCPYGAITFNSDKKVASVNAAVCKGCGACAAACPSEAAVLMGFDNRQLYAQIDTALSA
jgi:heterodisulfide reductase subunit A